MNYKKCYNCNQSYYPFRHGICPLCGEKILDLVFVKEPDQYFTSRGVKRWIKDGFKDLMKTI